MRGRNRRLLPHAAPMTRIPQRSGISPENLRQHIDQYAGAASLDLKAFNACLLNDKTEALVTQDKKDGDAIHVNSTPTFLINGVEVPGLPSSNVFDYVITSQLAEKSGGR